MSQATRPTTFTSQIEMALETEKTTRNNDVTKLVERLLGAAAAFPEAELAPLLPPMWPNLRFLRRHVPRPTTKWVAT